MSRLKTTIQVVLIAVVMTMAAGAPVSARTAAGRQQAQIVKAEKKAKLPTWLRWMMKRLSRYAMAAN